MIWQWVSTWLMCITVATTAIYNGFFSNELSADSWPRFAVVLIYAVGFCIHAVVVWSLCLQALTQVCAGAAWSLLNRARFAVVDRRYLFAHIADPMNPLDFAEIEKSSVGPTFVPMAYEAALVGRAPPERIPRSQTQTNALVAA